MTGFDEGRDRTAEAKITIGVKARSWSTARSFSLCAFARSFFLSLVLPLRVCELSLRVSAPEIIWSENRNRNEFPWSKLLFYGQMKMISGKFYFQNQPNSLFYGKWFPETIFTQNKHTLSYDSIFLVWYNLERKHDGYVEFNEQNYIGKFSINLVGI